MRASQLGSVTQTVNSTAITVDYSRPVARGRTLFGELIPWGEIWNPGANEATAIEFTNDVKIDGKELSAGRYSLWAIPGESRWTLIFSRAADVYHVPYPEGQDALRVDIDPVAGSHMEVLNFYFPEVGPNTTTLRLHWGTTVVPIPIEVPMQLVG